MGFGRAHNSRAAVLVCAAVLVLARGAFAACTLGTGACCLGAGGAGDSSATRRTWQPNANTTAWNTTNNWATGNVPNASNEEAYVQSDWRVPDYPTNDYTLACLQIASGSMVGIPTATVTVSIPASAAVTATNGSDRINWKIGRAHV